MKINYNPASKNIKVILLLLAILIAAGTLFYTQSIVQKLQNREKEIVKLYAQSLEFIANSNEDNIDFTFIFQNIIQRIDFPLILTSPEDIISSTKVGSGFKNIEIDSTLSEHEKRAFLNEKLIELRNIHPPILVTLRDSTIIQKIYFGDSDIVQRLKYYPYFQIIFAFLFIIIAYSSFNYLKRSEQSNIWVGMSKETAHQLGTPISSLMGWNEILRMNYQNPDKVLDATYEIESDLVRLNKITTRFSKIGSKPELKKEDLYSLLEKVVSYFQRRLPQTGKKVSLTLKGEKDLITLLNSDLFEWVIENLIKNSLDAIENKEGKIEIEVSKNKNSIEIEVTDNGKGIEQKSKKDIFKPGFSTKRRGWGLGLSLSRRIIENYHGGKIFVKSSVITQGTTMKIILKSEI
ncbi:MAG: HAMP domain-containing histidine kinase [Melioribacteraceae bacterium]|nr:HAMP domain-containing histidine kinase [Melioribacteraceae bacterium]